jgi:amino acid adenylation domain-containing protein/non-ribosomal peptide synthase protein (TIGR01720 family)
MSQYKNWISANQQSVPRLISEGELDFWKGQNFGGALPGKGGKAFHAKVSVEMNGNVANVRVQDIVITAYVAALSRALAVNEVVIEREGHGRNDISGYDVSDAIGFFTSKFPVKYVVESDDLDVLAAHVTQVNQSIPNAGVGYGILKYLSPAYIGRQLNTPANFGFNYLGDLSVVPSRGKKKGLIRGAHSVFSASLSRVEEGLANAKEIYWANLDAWIENGVLKCDVSAGTQMGFDEDGWLRFIGKIRNDIHRLLAAGSEQLTPFQKGLVSYVKSNPVSGRYVVQLAVTINERLPFELFYKACGILVARHEILRTCYDFDYESGKFTARVLPAESLQSAKVDSAAALKDIKEQGFAISAEPLIKFTLVNETIAAITAHHLVLDGNSIGILFKELAGIVEELKKGRQPETSLAYRLQFAHYVDWINQKDPKEAVRYWKERLDQYSPCLLESQTVGEAAVEAFGQFSARFELSTGRLNALKAEGITASAALNLITGKVLSIYQGQDKFVWGNVVTLRPADVSESEHIIGPCISTIPVAVDFGKGDLVELMKELQVQVLESRDHAYLPLNDIFHAAGATQLFSALFAFQNHAEGTGEDSNSEVISSHFPLTIVFELNGSMLRARVSYRRDQFAGYIIKDIVNGIVSLFNENENFKLSVLEGASQVVPAGNLAQRFVQSAAVHANKVAVADGTCYSYKELDEMSNYVANRLMEAGIRGGIGLRLKRSARLVAAIIGALKAGCYVVSLETEFPEEKLLWLHDELQLKAIITENTEAAFINTHKIILPDVLPCEPALSLPFIEASDLCTINYTSGSTGNPKMVLADHAGHLNRIMWLHANFQLQANDVFCFKTLLAFAPAIREIFEPLLQGAMLQVFPENALKDLDAFSELMVRSKVSRIFLTPTFLQLLLDNGKEACLRQLNYLEVSGEPARKELIATLQAKLPGVQILNRYGATEAASVVYNDHQNEGEKYFPLGKPIQNTKLHVVDEAGRARPRGVIGEILIESASMAKGYHNPADEEGVFIKKDGRTILKTGDLGFVNESGELCYHARKTRMIKIRGYRVELREIEFNLETHPHVSRAVAMPVETASGQRIVAFCVAGEAIPDLKTFLLQRMPAYMQPHEIKFIDKFPVTSSGKIDYVSLKASLDDVIAQSSTPETETEKALAEMLSHLLGKKDLNILASFFEMGVDSIAVLRIVHSIQKKFGISLKVSSFFEFDNIQKLSAYIDEVKALEIQSKGYYLMNSSPDNEVLFLFPPAGGNSLIYKSIEPYLPQQLTAVSFDSPEGDSLREIASLYIDKIMELAAGRRFHLAGWSLGGTMAYQVAVQLEQKAIPIGSLTLIDPGFNTSGYDDELTEEKLSELVKGNTEIIETLYRDSKLIKNYEPGIYEGDIFLIKPTEIVPAERNFNKPFNGLEKFCLGNVEVFKVDGNHMSMMGSSLLQLSETIFKNILKKASL